MAFPEAGDTVDIFVLRSKLHEGAMASLFLARDRLSKNNVVLKLPRGDILNSPVHLYHHRNEDRISRLVDHPGIVRFIHRQKSRQYIIMEHIQGKDLRSICGKNRRMGLNHALEIMDRLCSTVGYLHDKSIIHLDLKPENILLVSKNRIKLIDFGLAFCTGLPDLLSLDMDSPQGTPWYIPPEQLLGERSDPRCDIYAMGMLVYEMLTGCLPWPKTGRLSMVRRRLRHDPPPPRYHNPGIPPQVQSVIMRAISRHARDRYPSVQEFQDDLMNWQALPVTESGTTTRKPPWWRYLFPAASVQKPQKRNTAPVSPRSPRIVGCITSGPESRALMSELKRQALLRSAGVILVHVIEEISDFPERRYGIAAEGDRLAEQIEKAVQEFRRLNIDPEIRLVRGSVTKLLPRLCIDMEAQLLVLGRSGKKRGVFTGSPLAHHMEKQGFCPFIIAGDSPGPPAADLAAMRPDRLTGDQVLDLEVFLVDLWYGHLQYHTDFIYRLILSRDPESDRKIDLYKKYCKLGRFLASFDHTLEWRKIFTPLGRVHDNFHCVAEEMVRLRGNREALKNLYTGQSLPLSFRLKNEMAGVSGLIRDHLDTPPPVLPFLADGNCPFKMNKAPVYGPLLGILNLHGDFAALIHQGKEGEAVQ